MIIYFLRKVFNCNDIGFTVTIKYGNVRNFFVNNIKSVKYSCGDNI